MTDRGRVELRPIHDGDLGAVLGLNQRWVPHVGSLDESSLGSLASQAALVLGAWSTPAVPDSVGVTLGGEQTPAELAGFVIVLGAGAAYPSPNYRWFSGRHDRFTYVDRIAVAPFAQGRGVGRLLYDAVAGHARHSGSPVVCAEVNLDPPNPESMAFHLHYGFVEVGRQWTYDDTVEVQLLELVLP